VVATRAGKSIGKQFTDHKNHEREILLALCLTTTLLPAANWPGWRNDGNGVSSENNFH
jgi:hypothetical protein